MLIVEKISMNRKISALLNSKTLSRKMKFLLFVCYYYLHLKFVLECTFGASSFENNL